MSKRTTVETLDEEIPPLELDILFRAQGLINQSTLRAKTLKPSKTHTSSRISRTGHIRKCVSVMEKDIK